MLYIFFFLFGVCLEYLADLCWVSEILPSLWLGVRLQREKVKFETRGNCVFSQISTDGVVSPPTLTADLPCVHASPTTAIARAPRDCSFGLMAISGIGKRRLVDVFYFKYSYCPHCNLIICM